MTTTSVGELMERRQKEIRDRTKLVLDEASRLLEVGKRYARLLRTLPPPVCNKDGPDRSLTAGRLLEEATNTFRYMVCHWAAETLTCQLACKRSSAKGDPKLGWDAIEALEKAVATFGRLDETKTTRSSLYELRTTIGKIAGLTLGL